MKNIIDEILERRPSHGKQKHQKGCQCISCKKPRIVNKKSSSIHPLIKARSKRPDISKNINFEGLENETLPLLPCEPGRFQFGKLNVVRWGKRKNPCNRKIPKELKLGILSRGRIMLPFRNARSFLEEQKRFHRKRDKNFWLLRLERSLKQLAPKVHVTFELFIMQVNMEHEQILNTFQKYLERRVANEMQGCKFFVFDVKVASKEQKEILENQFGLNDFGVSLNPLYRVANVKLSGRSCGRHRPGENIDRFILLTYITFSSDLIWRSQYHKEKKLKVCAPPLRHFIVYR